EGHACRAAYRGGTAGQRGVPEPADAAVVAVGGQQHLTAPQRAVVAHAQAVVGDTEERFRYAVFGGGGDHVRVVVLDGDPLDAGAGAGVPGGQVTGVQVVGQHRGAYRVQVAQPLDRL